MSEFSSTTSGGEGQCSNSRLCGYVGSRRAPLEVVPLEVRVLKGGGTKAVPLLDCTEISVGRRLNG